MIYVSFMNNTFALFIWYHDDCEDRSPCCDAHTGFIVFFFVPLTDVVTICMVYPEGVGHDDLVQHIAQ